MNEQEIKCIFINVLQDNNKFQKAAGLLFKALELSIENNHNILAEKYGETKPYAAGCICIDFWLEQAELALEGKPTVLDGDSYFESSSKGEDNEN